MVNSAIMKDYGKTDHKKLTEAIDNAQQQVTWAANMCFKINW